MKNLESKSIQEFCQFLLENDYSNISEEEISEHFKDYECKINFFYHNCLSNDFSSELFEFYLIQDFITIECLSNNAQSQLLKIITSIPKSYAFDFISTVKNGFNDKNFFECTYNFLSIKSISQIYKSVIINEF